MKFIKKMFKKKQEPKPTPKPTPKPLFHLVDDAEGRLEYVINKNNGDYAFLMGHWRHEALQIFRTALTGDHFDGRLQIEELKATGFLNRNWDLCVDRIYVVDNNRCNRYEVYNLFVGWRCNGQWQSDYELILNNAIEKTLNELKRRNAEILKMLNEYAESRDNEASN